MKQTSEFRFSICPDMAEILGAFIGDGWIQSTLDALYILGDPTEDKEYYDTFLAPLVSEHICKVSPKFYPYWSVYGIGLFKKGIIRNLIQIGFTPGKKVYSAKFPKSIMLSDNLDMIKSALRGLFDTGGCFSTYKAYGKYDDEWSRTFNCKPRIEITTVSKILAQQCKALLDRLNIYSKIRIENARCCSNRNRATAYRVTIDRRLDIQRWFTLIGSNNPRQMTRYLVWKRFGHLSPRTTLSYRKSMLED